MILNRDQFLSAATALPFRDVDVPELGDGAQVRISVMSGTLRDRWQSDLTNRSGERKYEGLRALLVSMTAIDESGAPLFSHDDASMLQKTNGVVLDRLYDVAWEINKLGRDAVEEAAKN